MRKSGPPAEPMESVKSAEPIDPVDPVEPKDPVEPVEPVEPPANAPDADANAPDTNASHTDAPGTDAADADALRGFVGRVTERFGHVDHCIANAAVAYDGVLATLSDDHIEAMLSVNLKGSIVLVRESVRQMLVQPALSDFELKVGQRRLDESTDAGSASPNVVVKRSPSIVLISSVVASRGSPGLSVYAATKAGLEGFAKSLARELGPRGIRVNAVAPGFLETDLSASLSARSLRKPAKASGPRRASL